MHVQGFIENNKLLPLRDLEFTDHPNASAAEKSRDLSLNSDFSQTGLGGGYAEAPPDFFNRIKRVVLIFLSTLAMTAHSIHFVVLTEYE